MVKDGVRKALQESQKVLGDLVQAIREHRKLSDQPLTLRGSEYAHSVLELNKTIERAEGLLTGLTNALDRKQDQMQTHFMDTAQAFGGSWTATKLKILKGYLQANRNIFAANEKARF